MFAEAHRQPRHRRQHHVAHVVAVVRIQRSGQLRQRVGRPPVPLGQDGPCDGREHGVGTQPPRLDGQPGDRLEMPGGDLPFVTPRRDERAQAVGAHHQHDPVVQFVQILEHHVEVGHGFVPAAREVVHRGQRRQQRHEQRGRRPLGELERLLHQPVRLGDAIQPVQRPHPFPQEH